MTMDSAGLAKIPGVNHYEERFLIFLQWLRRPGTNIVYVTSEPIAPAILAYILDLLPGCGGAATRRLTMLDCGSRAPVPLSAKVLGRPDVVEAIRAAVPDPADAVLLAFNGSPVERALAVRLGIPLYAPDPDLAALGSKTGSRRLFAEAGIPMADGIEDLRGEADVVAALAELRGRDRTLGTALVKLNDSFGAGGNVLFSFAGAPRTGLTGWIRRELPARAEFASPPDTWETYREKLDAMGAVVERFVEAAQTASPSAQVLLAPGGAVRVLAAHDQVLSGPSGQIFVGCRFPARAGYRREIHRLALRAGRSLAGHGVVGLVSVDFLCARTGPGWRHYGLEINLRMGGGTAPFFTLLGLAGGDCDPVTGRYLDATGRPRAYFATDRLHRAEYQALDPAQVIATLERSGLRYEPASSTGVVAYMLGALEIGRFGIVSIDTGAAAATARYRRVVAAIDAAAAGREVSVPAPRRRPARRIRPG
ncbi:peptide ligase PGM1-related protein [Actinophytocola sp.]|uniref:peptide ligase PGM1-related protein n=1 Tax=Actinophytocola sp. TaxID=1872138 RepID=UPI002D7F485B|nr:hypothetical protein [Actinophytocola sp.]HET9141409.1 hypothetical protein [Actinophytocola sp.]